VSDVTVRFWAAARDAAGLVEERFPPGTLADVLTLAAERHGDRLRTVLARCSYLVDGEPVGKRDHATVEVPPGAELEVLPPFAGG
jgi:molybdopterin converting factor small subunit